MFDLKKIKKLVTWMCGREHFRQNEEFVAHLAFRKEQGCA